MGLNEPPKTATRATLFANLTVALDDVLGGRQLLDADGASCVHARRRDAHLGAHPELTAIDEARGGIDHHGGGVHLAREAPRVGERARHDRLGQARTVAPDVGDRVVEVVDHADGEDQVEVLLVPVARSVVSTNWMASAGPPAFSRALARMAAIIAFDSSASLPPRNTTALPDFTQRPAASAVTLGRAS